MTKVKESLDLLFETSWEVCNKVGGIYTVLSTKAHTLQEQLKDKTIFIGPDVWTKENPSPYFVETETELNDWASKAKLLPEMSVRVGRWNIPGKPLVILVKFQELYKYKNELYSEMWDKYHVDSLHAYGDYDEACAFGFAAAKVIESYVNYVNNKNLNIVAHFDEWTTGMGLLYVKSHVEGVATVFTTHATSIGRSICGNNKPLYDYLGGYNGDQMAQELNMQSKHSLEKAAAHNADCFTTVSDVTARECEELLDIRPHVVTPNGFERNFVPTPDEYENARSKARKAMLNVASTLMGREVSEDAMIVVTSGRHEFRNKGLDLFIDALNMARNNNNTDREIIAFIMVPGWVAGPRQDLKSALMFYDKSQTLPNPNVTHDIINAWEDGIINKLNYLWLFNSINDKLKVIYVPSYLTGDDGIFNMSYYDLLPGVDLTAFASYYEPWGYTPLESVAFGIPTISTDLSGYGQWILNNVGNGFDVSGSLIIHRNDSNYNDVVWTLAQAILYYAKASNEKVAAVRAAAMATAEKASWTDFIKYYDKAYSIALDSVNHINREIDKNYIIF